MELNKRSANIYRQSPVNSATQKESLFRIIINKCFMNACHALILRFTVLQGEDNILYFANPTATAAEPFNGCPLMEYPGSKAWVLSFRLLWLFMSWALL